MKMPPFETLVDQAFKTDALRELAHRGIKRRYRRNTIMIGEGDPGGSLFLVLHGRVRAYSIADDGREFVHGLYGPGEYVGEMALDGGPRTAYVRTETDAICVEVPKPQFEAHIKEHPEFAMEVIARLIGRARVSTENARALALVDTYGRICRLLCELAQLQEDGTRTIPEPLTHKEIANRIGSSREMVSRIVKDLDRGGYLTTEKRIITLVNDLPPGW